MSYTANDAQENMESLIAGLKKQFKALTAYMNNADDPLTFSEKVEINNLRTKVSIEIHHRELLAAFDAAAVEVIRPPTAQEVAALQDTLVELDRDLDDIADFQAVVGFAEDVMTQNAERFMEILKTIRMNA